MGTPDEETVRFELEPSGVAWLTIDRPEAANAIAPSQRNRLIEMMQRVNDDSMIRAAVITGSGERHFCGGGDLRHPDAVQPEGATPRSVGWVANLIRSGIQRLIVSILDCDKPVVAAVNGAAAGVGVHLALACDLVVAAENARFIEIFVRRGLVPDGAGAYLLARLVGIHQAKELAFLGDDLSAPDAARLGLVNRVVPSGELIPHVRELAERLAAGPTISLGFTKALINEAYGQDRAVALRDEAMACEVNSRTEDFAEGLRAFVERRAPRWRGR